LAITDRVRFAGFVTEQQKQTLLSESWVALTPSLKEGWGLTIVEAGAAGTPTVAFHGAGGVAEALSDGVTGLLAVTEDDFTDRYGHSWQIRPAGRKWARPPASTPPDSPGPSPASSLQPWWRGLLLLPRQRC
jgi:hypothetical protein